MYPWESALSGYEVCPEEVYGRNEIHVNGDIAFAAHQYYLLTNDSKWLQTYGYDIIYQTALFWTSRIKYNRTKNAYVINDVMPPDEYHYPVNNSVYTNIVAQMNIRLAIRYGELLNVPVPSDWKEIADKMFIPFDSTLRYHPEYEGFDITDPKSVVKQADVILIYYPLMSDAIELDVKENDLRYYGTVTDENGPAMTNSMFSIGWLDLGNETAGYESFKKNFDNIQEPFKVWSEVRGGKGAANFITAAGGYLQAMLFGYGGIRIKDDGLLYYNMKLVDTVDEIFWNGIKYLGYSIQMHRKGTTCSIKLLEVSNENPRVLCVAHRVINQTHYQNSRLLFKNKYFPCIGFLQYCN